MPTYVCKSMKGRLSADQKTKIARLITGIHADVTGAPAYFAQVIFEEIEKGNHFIGGAPLKHDHIFVHGHIRDGRAAVDKTRMIKQMAAAIADAAEVDSTGVWVYASEIPAKQMVEFGHVLPAAGDEPTWTDALPSDQREWMRSIASVN
jgi:phenylpyruvate tautomerase PptA (4-oxalocrotonate tautomerase family)